MDISNDTTFKVNNSIRVEFLGDQEAIVLDLDKETIYHLNKTSSFIIKQIIKGHNLEDIVKKSLNQFDADPMTIKYDIENLLKDLVDNGILSRNAN